jgi:hypothetical protein
MTQSTSRPAAWSVLEQALLQRRPVAVRYQGKDRVLCPHVLGYKNGRPRVLAYQAGGATSKGRLPDDPRQRWRSLLVDEVEDPRLVDGPWESADNFSTSTNGIDEVAIAINHKRLIHRRCGATLGKRSLHLPLTYGYCG